MQSAQMLAVNAGGETPHSVSDCPMSYNQPNSWLVRAGQQEDLGRQSGAASWSDKASAQQVCQIKQLVLSASQRTGSVVLLCLLTLMEHQMHGEL